MPRAMPHSPLHLREDVECLEDMGKYHHKQEYRARRLKRRADTSPIQQYP
jgi:hypothetical protein